VSQKEAAITQAVKFSKKCAECGLRNFPGEERCSRCDAELLRGSKRVVKPKEIRTEEISIESGKPGHSSIRRLVILASTLVVLFGVVLFYVRQDQHAAPEALSEVSVAPPATTDAESAASNPAEDEARSEESAKQVMARLKRFQMTAQPNMRYEDYDQMLNQLEQDLNNVLPSMVSQKPRDQSLRQEVAGALRDYNAARNWWKTTIRNSTVLHDSDRVERLQVEWASAQTHLDNAEKLLGSESRP
jgi:hypothetical protein